MYKSFLVELEYYNNRYHSRNYLLKKVGEGRSASVFKIPEEDKVIKVFFPGKEDMAATEISAYQAVGGLEPYFPNMYEYDFNFLVIDYIRGKTVFDFLLEGIFIEQWIVEQVEEALMLSRTKGLNPSDVHLKNIIVTDKGIKMIDLARFQQKETCNRWNDLKRAYYSFYQHPLFPKKIKASILEEIASLYKENKINL